MSGSNQYAIMQKHQDIHSSMFDKNIVQCVNCQFLLEKIWNYKNITKWFKKVFLTDNKGKKDLMHLFRVPREEMEATTEEYALLRQRVNNDLTIK